MTKPNLLRKGDTIGIFSPSGSVSYNSARLDLYERGLRALIENGYKVEEGKSARNRFYHMAASAQEKAADINSLFQDSTVAALLPSIGGHTASQILSFINLDIIQANPKIFIGFSDSALLAAYITEKTGLITFHSAADITFNISRFGSSDCPMQDHGNYTSYNLWQMLEKGSCYNTPYSDWICLQPGDCKGTLIGGNLKGIMSLLGTPFEPNWKGKILYWEAADPPHVMAQVLAHLRNARVFEKISGMIVGKIAHLKETFYGQDEIMPIHNFIPYILDNPRLPVIVEADFGHDVENITIPNGSSADLTSDKNGCYLHINY